MPARKKKTGSSYDSMLESVLALAESIQALNQRAVEEYTPVVNDLLRSRSCDSRQIEHTLDGLLDFCGHAPVLLLYRRLCRHYFTIDPAATIYYVNAYREMWDTESEGDRS